MRPNIPVRTARLLLSLLLPLGVGGCALTVSQAPYYGDNWKPPSVSSLSTNSERGNLGGGTVTISGSGFGTDPDQVVVQFGDASADIQAIADDSITVTVPPGPISGGDVQVRVATKTGYSAADTPYTYDVSSLYANEIGYVQINNFWESCLGGLSSRTEDEHSANIGCTQVAYLGYSGIDGQAEGLTFAYPRLHAENIGFLGGTDQAPDDWVVERPGQGAFASNVDELKFDMEKKGREVKRITLTNTFWDDQDPYCADLSTQASYRYGGGDPSAPKPYTVTDDSYKLGEQSSDGCNEGETEYDLSHLDFCPSPTADGVPDYIYRPDWPVSENFFIDSKRKIKPVQVTLSAEAVLKEDQKLALPEPIVVYADQGFETLIDGESTAGDLWGVSQLQTCFDDDGNGEKLDDVALSFSWQPSTLTTDDADFGWSDGGDIVGHQTYVRVTLTALSLNWFGTVGYPIRATVVVDDKNNYDRQTGLSHVDVPASVMYQIPTVELPQAGGIGGQTALLDPTKSDWGYLLVTVERVTDYTIHSTAGGDIVFSYTTGDFGFYGWTNPTDQDECHDCKDGDGDGWTDAEDPDCSGGSTESGRGNTACNDGRDNDGDGRADANDPDCASGSDDDESNCSDGVDNDGDGILDASDPDCVAGGNEGDSDPICENGQDDDEDGWIDAADPDCVTGVSELGFGASECNDGVDNDGDGATDAADTNCATADGSESVPPTGCENGTDDDADGWTDADDPDCATGTDEVGTSSAECNDGIDNDADGFADASDPDCTSADATEAAALGACENLLDDDGDGWTDILDPDCTSGTTEAGLGSAECNNGVDDDGDGAIDASDPECLTAGGTESAAVVTGCNDGLDGDLDGWVDGEDPDCASGSEELGFGTTQCNDGVDNDEDSAIDVFDADCTDASDDDESL